MSALAKKNLDVSKIFLAYLSLQGDVTRTALACQIEPETVKQLAEQEQWSSKLKNFAVLKEQDENFQISLNRVLNFVQARQLSALVDKIIVHMQEKDLVDLLTHVTKNGASFETKPIADLVKAAEAIQAMTCRALGDAGGSLGTEEKGNGATIGLSVARALNEVASNQGMSAVQIVQKSLASDEPAKLA